MELVPGASALPLVEATPAGHSGAEAKLLGQMLPRDPGVEHKQDSAQRLPIRQAATARIAKGYAPSPEGAARPVPRTRPK